MKNQTEDIDKLIKETLTQEEAKFYDSLEEQHVFAMIGGLFKGKNTWLLVIMNIVTVVFFGLLVYCLVQAFEVQDTNALILWLAGAFFCFIIIGMLKIFAWMQMHRNALTREIKRLELQVSSLSVKLGQ